MSQPQSKFSGALAALNRKPTDSEAAPPAADAVDAAAITPLESRGKGRPPGKRSNVDYRPTTVFLRKRTKNAAQQRLMDDPEGRDLSELIEQLLAQWITAQ
jgi:hypothetical protein